MIFIFQHAIFSYWAKNTRSKIRKPVSLLPSHFQTSTTRRKKVNSTAFYLQVSQTDLKFQFCLFHTTTKIHYFAQFNTCNFLNKLLNNKLQSPATPVCGPELICRTIWPKKIKSCSSYVLVYSKINTARFRQKINSHPT
jgi:hypothetical protein